MKLYDYWRSSAAYRVRIALNLKGLKAEHVPVNIAPQALDNRQPAYLSVNPAGKLPSLEVEGATLVQSLAILEYLDETHPEPPLLPADPVARAHVRAFAQTIACDTHPIQNSRVLAYLKERGGFDGPAITAWVHEWINAGLSALEETVSRQGQSGPHAFGAQVTAADICLVPQMYNARRFEVDLSRYPRLVAIDEAARALDAVAAAAPERQADAPKGPSA